MALDPRTLEAAATWYVQLQAEHSEADRQAWRDWLDANPAHAQAWARLERLQRQLGGLPPEALPALANARARRRAVLKILGLLGIGIGVTGLALERNPPGHWLAEHRTATGQRRSLRLADRSHLELNTDSALDLLFDDRQRLIRLYRGELLAETAADPVGRPFIVETAEGRVRALGTRFSVRSEDGRSRVTVLEQAVEIRPARWTGQPVRLGAGQRIDFTADHLGEPGTAPEGADAWTRGMLSVVEWRLGDFIAELARYRPGFLHCDEAVAGLRLSGAFRLDDTDVVLENLARSLPIRLRHFTRYWVRIEPA
ncbi:Anti-sigma factor protein, FecR family [Azotobacter vinelandii CA]|uniref:Anti-sigma factor protein, FecR family n=2 Tax=Azotobacter vinelandii TaxID=354 RepID=C1DEC0_AZOVD|nr:FecR domain-containing protein [Azotobacter vinelandii]ACO80228.1 Anti-sigma factor protein, FecR family [Azotobacter vinelandii DJ]AGK16066.1 Anti-sigma factor protein, FecR family [Azotobacter vinelandii CA]AGK21783.1 Anti-sigma factor protein, FecR family [Azotobacter vinelandii CA6]SFX72724.1 FecR family protein [Azotobacter vinelandii]GLK61811.1 sensor [Azotobacter vinelandii]